MPLQRDSNPIQRHYAAQCSLHKAFVPSQAAWHVKYHFRGVTTQCGTKRRAFAHHKPSAPPLYHCLYHSRARALGLYHSRVSVAFSSIFLDFLYHWRARVLALYHFACITRACIIPGARVHLVPHCTKGGRSEKIEKHLLSSPPFSLTAAPTSCRACACGLGDVRCIVVVGGRLMYGFCDVW